jgi:ABC-type glycerol-3-phosphate transport system permease component
MARTAILTPSSAVVRRPKPRGRRPSLSPGRTLAWTYLAVFLLMTLFPFYWILRTSLSNNYALIAHPSSLLPVGLTLGPYERVLGFATPQ